MHIYFLQTFVSSLFPFQTTNIFFVAQLFILPFFAKFSIFLWVSISSKPRIHTHFYWNEKPNETPTKNVHIKPKKQKRWMQISHNKVIALDTKIKGREHTHTYQQKKNECPYHFQLRSSWKWKRMYKKNTRLGFFSSCLMWWFVLNTITTFLSCHKNKFHQFT